MGNPSVQRNEANKSQDGAYEPYPPAFLGSSFFVAVASYRMLYCTERGNTRMLSMEFLVFIKNKSLKSGCN